MLQENYPEDSRTGISCASQPLRMEPGAKSLGAWDFTGATVQGGHEGEMAWGVQDPQTLSESVRVA